MRAEVVYRDADPDSLGRRHFTLTWVDEGGVWRPENGPDGQQVGFRRGQCFFAVPALFVPPGSVEWTEAEEAETGTC